jgi:hypothetical protein
MKLLLDENLPVKLNHFFSDNHEVKTVIEQGWTGKKNGELLGLMTFNGFDGLVTIDKSLIYQQNINRFDITIFILDAPDNKITTLKPFIRELESYSGTTKENIAQINVGE